MKATETLVGHALYGDGRKADAVVDRQPADQVLLNAGPLRLELREVDQRTGRVHVHRTAEGGANLRMLAGGVLQNPVKTRRHHVVAVQDMHPLTAGALNARGEVGLGTDVGRLAEIGHPPLTAGLDHCRWVVARRTVVDHLDLHVRVVIQL